MISAFNLSAQMIVIDSSAFLDINKIKARIRTGGELFFDDSGNTLSNFEYPKDSSTNTVFESHLSILGKYQHDLHMAQFNLNYIFENKRDFYPGPVMDSTVYPSEVANWNKVWKINKSQIDYHVSHWNTPGYTMPTVISHWPVYASPVLQINHDLAPYVDVNGNNVYDPAAGDYPYIRGDQAVYFIYNDSVFTHKGSDGKKMGVEIHGMAYEFSSIPLLNKTVFVNFTVYNKSPHVYDSVYLGLWTDIDVGYPTDDYIGSDTSTDSYFGYNGDAYDETAGGTFGYGANIPVQTVTFLNTKMAAFFYPNNTSSTCDSCPNNNPQYFNFVQGLWCDGSHFCYGGNGHQNCGGNPAIPVNHLYSGNPNDTNAWHERSVGNVPYDRRGMGSCGPFTFNPGQYISLDVAYILIDSGSFTTGISPNIDNMYEIVPLIQNYFDNNFPQDGHDMALGIKHTSPENELIQMKVFPNPANDYITLSGNVISNDLMYVELMDVNGRVLDRFSFDNKDFRYNISNLNKGVYFLRFIKGINTGNARFVKM
jgi:hypothetical protein